jgi:HEAT repeat protein
MRILGAVLALLSFLCSCSTEEPSIKKKLLPQSEYNFRDKEDEVLLFSQLDHKLKQWVDARKQRDDATIAYLEHDLFEMTTGNLDRLREVLEESENHSYRVIAAMALGFSDSPKALGTLIDQLEDREERIVANCLTSIGFLGQKDTPLPPLVRLLREGSPHIQGRAAYAIGECSAPKRDLHGAESLLIDLLKHDQIALRVNAMTALGKLQQVEAVRPIVINNLFHQYPKVRLDAIAALGNINHVSAVGGLVESLSDENERVRQRALWALKKITEKDYGENQAAWKHYYESHKESFK